MSLVHKIILLLSLIIWLGVDTYVFRFQRTTLSLSRMALGAGNIDIQIALTPSWMGLLGWLNKTLLVLNVVLLFIWVAWWAPLLLLFYSFVLAAFVDTITPVPSYTHCLNIIETHLEREAKSSAVSMDAERLKDIESFRDLIRTARSQYNL